jgi:bifunctional ADP-heptose synthase (sugar kinase/adenylyltransferase)
LDTRSKIIPIEEARQQQRQKSVYWLAGHFDPLLLEHARTLREHVVPGRMLIVEVVNSARPLLPQLARAELVAALDMVDYVVLGNGTSEATAIDAAVAEKFIDSVLNRHRRPGVG